MAETREFTRVTVHVKVDLNSDQRRISSSRTRDLSLNGLYLFCNSPLPSGSTCALCIELGLDEQTSIRATARVVRQDDQGMALHFESLIGSDSLVHLQNLVRYNSLGVENVEDEFKRHTGLVSR